VPLSRPSNSRAKDRCTSPSRQPPVARANRRLAMLAVATAIGRSPRVARVLLGGFSQSAHETECAARRPRRYRL
jgi:hypothetical protein